MNKGSNMTDCGVKEKLITSSCTYNLTIHRNTRQAACMDITSIPFAQQSKKIADTVLNLKTTYM
jgi:hypothetical protein